MGAICLWSTPDATAIHGIPQRESAGQDGKEEGVVLLEEPHRPWAGHPGEEVWPERRHRALGGHLERVTGGGTGAGRSSREGPTDGTKLEGEEAAKPSPRPHRHGHASDGPPPNTCDGTFRKLCRLYSTRSMKGSHTHTQSRILSCVCVVLCLSVLGDIWGPDSWTSTSPWLLLLRARGSVHTAGCSESVSVSSPCFLVKASGRGPPSHTGSPKITHSHIYTHIHTRTHAHTCIHTRTGRLTHTYACTLTHINTHMYTRTLTHTCTPHPHTCNWILPSASSLI